MAFFATGTPAASAVSPGGPVTIEFDPPVCLVYFPVQQNDATFRDDFYLKVWTDEGGLEGNLDGLFVDATGSGSENAPVYGVSICNGATRRITKIEFGFDGLHSSGDPIAFAIGDVGFCI